MDKRRLSYLGVAINVILLGLKLWAGLVSGSIAAISDALNSLLDVFSYTALSVAVYVQEKEPDDEHPFGHRRAEPLAGMVIAIVAAILGGTIIKDSLVSFFSPEAVRVSSTVLVVLALAVAIKAMQAAAYYVVGKRSGSKALIAGFIDSRNDIFASSVVLFGVYTGGAWDEVAALAVGGWILYSGVSIGLENAGYLMGKGPGPEVVSSIRDTALSVPGVEGIDEIRAHFVGDLLHVDVHVEVSGRLTVVEAHDISDSVKRAVDELPEVNNTFVHIDIGKGKGETAMQDKPELYKDLNRDLRNLLAEEDDALANLANAAALIYERLEDINWAGFYLQKGEDLVLGPFQGRPACVRIPIGKGVCGTAVAEDAVQLVPDVHQFPGHIACDPASRSEVVIPLHFEGKIVGVLDIDSPTPARFDEDDRRGLQECARTLEELISWHQLTLQGAAVR